jgi:hypothetical protein
MTKKLTPIPNDLREFVRVHPYGPCHVEDNANFLVLDTNQVGKLELHPCSMMREYVVAMNKTEYQLCYGWFAHHTDYGWLEIRDRDLLKRAMDLVDQARADKIKGWVYVKPKRSRKKS